MRSKKTGPIIEGESELRKAESRIGGELDDEVRWLLELANKQLDELSEGDWANLRSEIAWFAGGTFKNSDTVKWPWGSNRWEHFPSRDHIIEIIENCKGWIHSVVEKETEDIFFPPLTLKLVYALEDLGPNEGGWRGKIQYANRREAFYYKTWLRLASHGNRIRQCPECLTIFLADRRNQAYCTVKCQGRVATRKYRQIPPDRIGKRGRPPGSKKTTKIKSKVQPERLQSKKEKSHAKQ